MNDDTIEIIVEPIVIEINPQIVPSIEINTSTIGIKGDQGDGLSAYELALEEGFVGTEAQWLDSFQNRSYHTGTQLANTISDFQATVSANTDVTANTLSRHNAVTVTDSDTLDFTLTGQDITAIVKDGSIHTTQLSSGVNTSLNKANASREVLTANRTYFVRTDGNDSNNGLVDSSNGSFLTWQKAIDTASALDSSIYDVTIQCGGSGERIFNAPILLKPLLGSGVMKLIGDVTNMSNVILDGVGGGATIITSEAGGRWGIEYFRLRKTIISGACLHLREKAIVSINNLDFADATVGTSFHIRLEKGATLNRLNSPDWTYKITGSAYYHITCNGSVSIPGTGVVVVENNPVFNTFALASEGGGIIVGLGLTYSGSATGIRYNCSLNGYIRTFGGGANYFPGNIEGSISNGGLYV